MPFCLSCGAGIDDYDSAYYARNMLCIPCYVRKASEIAMVNCTRCGIRVRQEEAKRRGSGMYCNYCASELERQERTPICPLCKKAIESWQKSTRTPDGHIVHRLDDSIFLKMRNDLSCQFPGTICEIRRIPMMLPRFANGDSKLN